MVFFLIIVKMNGGLGNQLFIYAFGRSLAYDLNKELYLDLSRYSYNIHSKHISFGLIPYKIKGIAGYYPLDSYKNRDKRVFEDEIKLYSNGGDLTQKGRFYKDLLFDNMNDIQTPAYFTGDCMAGYDENNRYVITENFFKHNKDIIRDDLKFLGDLDDEYKDIAEDIKQHESVALHLRRGDYINHPEFGMCSSEYYNDAILEIAKHIENPKFFIFTQDYDWFEKNINLNYPYRFVDSKENMKYMDHDPAQILHLMSLCKHFVISNSTFSWWGAWLSENTNKKIIAPSPWFQSRDFLKTETIDGIEPISITNNYKSFYDKSKKILFKLKDLDDFREITNVNVDNQNLGLFIKTLKSNSRLLLNHEFNNTNPLIVKITIKSFAKEAVRIYYRRSENEEFVDRNSSYVWYYDDEEFTHYLILPRNIKHLMIKPAALKDIPIILRDLEIKEIDDEIAVDYF